MNSNENIIDKLKCILGLHFRVLRPQLIHRIGQVLSLRHALLNLPVTNMQTRYHRLLKQALLNSNLEVYTLFPGFYSAKLTVTDKVYYKSTSTWQLISYPVTVHYAIINRKLIVMQSIRQSIEAFIQQSSINSLTYTHHL